MWYFKCALSVASEIYKLWTRLKQQSWGKRCWTIEWRRRQWTASTSRRRVKEKRKSLHTHHISVQLDTRAHLLPPPQKIGGVVHMHVEWQLWAGEGATPYIMYSAKHNLITASWQRWNFIRSNRSSRSANSHYFHCYIIIVYAQNEHLKLHGCN